MKDRFERAFQALTTAYFEGTLAAGTCTACAVGNMVAYGCGATIKQYRIGQFITSGNYYWIGYLRDSQKSDTINLLETSTGYSIKELSLIENAFEENTFIPHTWYVEHTEQEILEDQYNGLAAVIEVLCQLDGITEVAEHKAEFRKHPRLVTV